MSFYRAYHPEYAPNGRRFDALSTPRASIAADGWCDSPAKFGQKGVLAFDEDPNTKRDIPGVVEKSEEWAAEQVAKDARDNASQDHTIAAEQNKTPAQHNEEMADRQNDAYGGKEGWEKLTASNPQVQVKTPDADVKNDDVDNIIADSGDDTTDATDSAPAEPQKPAETAEKSDSVDEKAPEATTDAPEAKSVGAEAPKPADSAPKAETQKPKPNQTQKPKAS